MAKVVLFDCFVEVAGTELTDHVSSVTVTMRAEELDVTTFADDNKRRAAGMGDDSFQFNVHHDFAAASVDQVLQPLAASGADFLVRVRPSSAPVSVTNPEYSGSVLLLEYAPLAGDAGELSQTSITLPAQGARIARATS